jgi:hypothetical protein
MRNFPVQFRLGYQIHDLFFTKREMPAQLFSILKSGLAAGLTDSLLFDNAEFTATAPAIPNDITWGRFGIGEHGP